MGMFDSLKCTKVMPDGFQSNKEDEFQFKEFECTLSSYEINKDNKLILVTDRSDTENLTEHINFTGELHVIGGNGPNHNDFHHYIFEFVDSILTEIR